MYKNILLIVQRQTRVTGRPLRTFLVRFGILLAAASGLYLIGGMASLAPLSAETLAWNNVRVIAGMTIFGCLMAAIGYGNH